MSVDIETLKAIKEKENESRKRLQAAKEEVERLVKEAEEEAARIMREADENGKKIYDEYVKNELESASKESAEIRSKFDERIAKLKKEVSAEILDKIIDVVMENEK
jgi:vacuolar-type H+-ATPase subunit H